MWDFLIQKEGERQWKTLKASKNSLPEGRYRLVAHSSLKQTDVEIQVFYTAQKRKPQSLKKQTGQTNAQGLIMLLPYTDLQPGLWQVTCSNSLISELSGEVWHQTRQLEIVGEQVNQEQITQLEDLIKLEIEPYLEKHSAQSLVRAKFLPHLQLVLNQNSFFSLQGEVIPIFGRIEMKDQQFPYLILSNFKIRYQIQNPQTGEILINLEQAISIEHLPFDFQYFLEIPNNLEANTFKGQVSLETFSHSVNVVASQTFSLITEQRIQKSPHRNLEDAQSTRNLYIPPSNHPALPPRLTEKSSSRKEVTLPTLPKSYLSQDDA